MSFDGNYYDACKRITELAAELADWMRMRNEAMAVATSNRARIRELEAQDEVHWKTRRTLLAERDALAAELAHAGTQNARIVALKTALRQCWTTLGIRVTQQEKFLAEFDQCSEPETPAKPVCGCTSQSGCLHRTDRICVMETEGK